MFKTWPRRSFCLPIVCAFALAGALMTPVFAASGSFIGVQGESVRGTASVKTKTITLSSSFKSSSGPDLYVYLGNSKPSRIIGRLRKLSGGQSYALPKGIDLSKYSAVFIHCKRYNHTYGKARLR